MLTELEVNQTITESMELCWHEPIFSGSYGPIGKEFTCKNCKVQLKNVFINGKHQLITPENPAFTSSWSDYGKALEWAMKQEWWGDFHTVITFDEYRSRDVIWTLLNPLRGSTALAEFLKEKKLGAIEKRKYEKRKYEISIFGIPN